MTKPISPSEVVDHKKRVFPPEVIEVFNDLIAKNYTGRQAVVFYDEAARAIASKLGIKRTDVFDHQYLDVEDLYRSEGWKVTTDSPGYNESYRGSFTFRK